MSTFFPQTVSSIFRLFSDTLRPTQRRSLQMLDVVVPQIGVAVFHAWLFRGGADGRVSRVFVSTDARRPYPRGVIGSMVGTYPRGTGSNPVEGNGHFFPSYRQLYLSSFSDKPPPPPPPTHTHTHKGNNTDIITTVFNSCPYVSSSERTPCILISKQQMRNFHQTNKKVTQVSRVRASVGLQ